MKINQSILEKALLLARKPEAQTDDGLLSVLTLYHSSWKGVVEKYAKEKIAVGGDNQARVLQIGYLKFAMEAGNYSAVLCRDLGLTAVELQQITAALVLLDSKLVGSRPKPNKSITRNMYDRVRQIGR